jgi:GTP-binding protein EngB required for normal cell division
MDSEKSKLYESRYLLDIVDSLRSQGIRQYVDLPEIIVCGDQSSGKSSVLEAISTKSFPTKDNLCTRFATELILRRTGDTGTSCEVSIIPDPERLDLEKRTLKAFKFAYDKDDVDLSAVVEQAKLAMGLSDARRFSNDILRVEISGPSQPHLTMVDLPGLFSSSNRDQSDSDAKTVKAMVRKYIERPRSIILAVISAKNDFVNQMSIKLIRKIDPDGKRTMGLITKPDTLHPNSSSQRFYIDLVQNKDVVFRLGWHVLRNRDFPDMGSSPEERNEVERTFFSSGVWTSLDPAQLGVEALLPRLHNLLIDQILLQLPRVLSDVTDGIADSRSRLEMLGPARTSYADQRKYLIDVSRRFTRLIESAVDGTYHDTFFGNVHDDEEYSKNLRAVVQNTLTDFAADMHNRGKSRRIVDSDEHFDANLGKISRSDYIDEVNILIRRSRGRELQGTFNPLIISSLFLQQCQPWRKVTLEWQEKIVQATFTTINRILDHVSAPETRYAILQMINTSMEAIKRRLDAETEGLLAPHYERHPITYDEALLDDVADVQSTRRKQQLTFWIKKYEKRYEGDDLAAKLAALMDLDMKDLPATTAIDYMEAYFEVRLVFAFSGRIILVLSKKSMIVSYWQTLTNITLSDCS